MSARKYIIYLFNSLLIFLSGTNFVCAGIMSDTVSNTVSFYKVSATTLIEETEEKISLVGDFYSPLLTSSLHDLREVIHLAYVGSDSILNGMEYVGNIIAYGHEEGIRQIRDTYTGWGNASREFVAQMTDNVSRVQVGDKFASAFRVLDGLGRGVGSTSFDVLEKTGDAWGSVFFEVADFYNRQNVLIDEAQLALGNAGYEGVSNIFVYGNEIGKTILDSEVDILSKTGKFWGEVAYTSKAQLEQKAGVVKNAISKIKNPILKLDDSFVATNKSLVASVGSVWDFIIDKISDPLVPLFEKGMYSTSLPIVSRPNVSRDTKLGTEDVATSSSPKVSGNKNSGGVSVVTLIKNNDVGFYNLFAQFRNEIISLNNSSFASLRSLMERQEYKSSEVITKTVNNVSSGGVTSVDVSGGVTGLSFSGGPITSSGVITLGGVLEISNGGTGTSSLPAYGQMLVGNSLGGYDLVATSSLGIVSGGGSVTSVALSAPTGFVVSGSPVTSSGTIGLSFDTGYGLPLIASTTEWDNAYTNRITSASGPLSISSHSISLSTAGDWAGTFDGHEGSYYLNASNLLNFDIPFSLALNGTTTDALAEGINHKYYSTSLFNTDFATKTTDNLAEGSSNLFFTIGRVASVIAATTTDALAEGTNHKYYASSLFNTDFATKTTDNLAEGSSNLFFTANRVATILAATTTDTIAQGTNNKYYSTSLFNTDFGLKSTTDLLEGSNLYFTNDRVNSYLNSSTTVVKSYGNNTFGGTNTFNGTVNFGSFNGPLQANGGLVSATSSIGVIYGGTGLTTAPAYGNLLVGNGSGGYTLTATTSLGITSSQWVTSGSSINYSTGNVGIGTSTPYGRFAISDDTSQSTGLNIVGNVNGFFQANIQNTSSGASASSDWVATANNGNDTTHYVDFGINGSGGATAPFATANHAYLYSISDTLNIGALGAGNNIQFYTTGGTSPVERMRLDSNGNLGIGTTTPFATLAVNPIAGGASNQFVVGSSTATSFIITSAGKVGIGTTNPGTSLDVSGLTTISSGATWSTSGFTGEATGKHLILGYDTTNSVGYIGSTNNGTAGTEMRYRGLSHTFWTGSATLSQTMSVTTSGISSFGTVDVTTASGSNKGVYFPVIVGGSGTLLNIYGTTDSFSYASLVISDTKDVSATANQNWQFNFRSADGRLALYRNTTAQAANSSDELFTFNTNGRFGVGSSTPFATLAVNPIAGGASNQFVVGSSTATSFLIDNGGRVGIGTTSPTFALAVSGTEYISGTSTLTQITAASTTFDFRLPSTASGYQLRYGVGSDGGVKMYNAGNGGGSYIDFRGNNNTVLISGATLSGTFFSGAQYLTTPWLGSTNSSGNDVSWVISKTGNGGGQTISALTQMYASNGNNGPKLIIGANGIDFVTRDNSLWNEAYDTIAMSIASSTAYVGVGTTSPWRKFSVTGTVGFSSLTGSTGAGSLCLSANNEVVYNSGSDSCLPSLRETKHDITDLTLSASDIISSLNSVSFIYNTDASSTLRYGFIAEDTAQIDPHLATYDAKGKISGIDDRAVISVLVKAFKELKSALDGVLLWFGDGKFKIQNEVCVDDVCVTKEQFKQMLLNNGGATQNTVIPESSGGDDNISSTTDTGSGVGETGQGESPNPEETPGTVDQVPAPDPEPAPAPEPSAPTPPADSPTNP